MITGGKDGFIDRALSGNRVTGRTRTVDQLCHRPSGLWAGPEPRWPWHFYLELAFRSNSMNHLLKLRAIGEHRKFKCSPRATGKINKHIPAIPDIRCLAFVCLVQMIDHLTGACHHPDRIGFQSKAH